MNDIDIARFLAEQNRAAVEIQKLAAETRKLQAEERKLITDRAWYPAVALSTAVGAGVGATLLVLRVLGKV
jgi:hypothetical protein